MSRCRSSTLKVSTGLGIAEGETGIADNTNAGRQH